MPYLQAQSHPPMNRSVDREQRVTTDTRAAAAALNVSYPQQAQAAMQDSGQQPQSRDTPTGAAADAAATAAAAARGSSSLLRHLASSRALLLESQERKHELRMQAEAADFNDISVSERADKNKRESEERERESEASTGSKRREHSLERSLLCHSPLSVTRHFSALALVLLCHCPLADFHTRSLPLPSLSARA